jgi:hypothetical protein
LNVRRVAADVLLMCGHCWDVERLLWISVIKDSTGCLLANLQVSSLSPAPNTDIETAVFLCCCEVSILVISWLSQ